MRRKRQANQFLISALIRFDRYDKELFFSEHFVMMKRNIRSLFVHVQTVELLERVIARGAYIIDVYGV